MTPNLQALRTFTEDTAKEAAQVLLHYYHQAGQFTTQVKSGLFDVVTEADKEAEKVIVGRISAAYPQHHIIGEEGGGMGAPLQEAAYRWYVDPIDGTTNFANRLPMFCTSIGLADAAMNPLVGVVYNPVTDELFSTAAGQGVTLNGAAIGVSRTAELAACVVASDFPYDKAQNADNNLAQWGRFATRTRALRCLGSAALDLCFVACGRLDGYWEKTLSPWDFMAGVLCVLEAGGHISDYAGRTGPEVYAQPRMVASNGRIHAQMLALLQEPL